MARFYTDFREEPQGAINDLSLKWELARSVAGRTTSFMPSGNRRKLYIDAGATAGQNLVGFKDSKNFNYSNTIETLVRFSIDTATQVPGSFGIINHKYNASAQGLSVAFLPASNVKSLFLYDDKNGVTVTFANYNWSVGVGYWVRYRQENTQHYVKIWPDGSAEPAGWTMTATYDIGTVSGDTWAGLGTYTSNHQMHYYEYALATNGDTAVAEYTGTGTYYNGYANRKKLSIDKTKVSAFTGYFQTLVKHTDPDLRTVANGGKVKKNPLLDIRFEDIYGNQLAHEIGSYDETTGAVEAWVRLDSVSTAVDTEYYIYFGKDLAADTFRGIKLGYGSATQMVIDRNYDRAVATENQGEASVLITGLKNPSMQSVTDPNSSPIVGQEEVGKPLVGGFLMYSVENLNTRFGMSTGWNNHVILVYHDGSTWRYDNNSTYVAFTPVSTDFLIAEMSWGQNAATGRAVNYAGHRPAGEEKPWMVWSDLAAVSDEINAVANNFRNVSHFDGIPDSVGATYEQPDVNRFAMNFGGYGNMNASNKVPGKVGSGVFFNINNSQFLRAKKDVIWHASAVGFVSMWFNTASVAGNQGLFSRRSGVNTGDGVGIFLLGSQIRVDFTAGSQWATGWNAAPNTWYHLVAQTDGTTRRLFVNGVQVASQASTIGWATGGDYPSVQVGASVSDMSGGAGNYFTGIIDEFRLYASSRENGYFLTDYNNQNSPSTFYSVGALEQAIVVNALAQPGNARIQKAISIDQLGNARIQRSESIIQGGNARIQRSQSLAQAGNARIQKSASLQQPGNARITRINSVDQSGNATLESYFFPASVDQVGNARIQKNNTISQPGNATIEKNKQIEQIGNAFIELQRTLDQPGNSRIARIESISQVGRAVLIRIDSLEQTGNARISRLESVQIVGNARISNPSPDKRPQEWSDSNPEAAATWSEEDRVEQPWTEADDKPAAAWENTAEPLDQQWSDSDKPQPTEWQRQYYD